MTRDLKTSLLLFTLCFTMRVSAHAQGTIIFPPVFAPLVINFVAVSNSPGYYLPSGTGSYITNGNFFSLGITATVPTNTNPSSVTMNAVILELLTDGSLIPMPGSPAFNVSGETIGTPSSVAFSTSSVQLTPDLAQQLMDGHLFVRSDLPYGEYLGQVKLVPEPSSIALFWFAVGIFGSVQSICRKDWHLLTMRCSERRRAVVVAISAPSAGHAVARAKADGRRR